MLTARRPSRSRSGTIAHRSARACRRGARAGSESTSWRIPGHPVPTRSACVILIRVRRRHTRRSATSALRSRGGRALSQEVHASFGSIGAAGGPGRRRIRCLSVGRRLCFTLSPGGARLGAMITDSAATRRRFAHPSPQKGPSAGLAPPDRRSVMLANRDRGSLTAPPLPHHHAYGSVHDGSVGSSGWAALVSPPGTRGRHAPCGLRSPRVLRSGIHPSPPAPRPASTGCSVARPT